MKNYIIIFLGIIAVSLTGCTEEKDYRLESTIYGNVGFMASNITVSANETVDYAESTRYDDYFYENGYREGNSEFTLKFMYRYDYENQTGSTYPLTINLSYYALNTLWAGGNNDIKVVFSPSCQEEKSAKFTFPDGQSVELSRENPSYIWQLNKDSYHKAVGSGYSQTLPIYAISEYFKDGFRCVNCGYVLISLNNEGENIVYDKDAGIWFLEKWTN